LLTWIVADVANTTDVTDTREIMSPMAKKINKRDGAQPVFDDGLVVSIEVLRKQMGDFGPLVLNALQSEPGPRAIFYHHGMLIERLFDMQTILRRMGIARRRMTVLFEHESRYSGSREPRNPQRFSKAEQTILIEQHRLTNELRTDAESFYMFANLALDQLSFWVAYCLNVPDPRKYKFAYLVDKLQGGQTPAELQGLKAGLLEESLWAFYQVRFYRNVFIEHVDRPWQRGSTMSHMFDDFCFFICVPPDWIAEAELGRILAEVEPLVPDWVKQLPEDDWQRSPRAMLEAAFREIEKLPSQTDRDKVWRAWSQIGGKTVSYHILAGRTIAYISAVNDLIMGIIGNDTNGLNLGHPSTFGT
jgi:hypothetical protein